METVSEKHLRICLLILGIQMAIAGPVVMLGIRGYMDGEWLEAIALACVCLVSAWLILRAVSYSRGAA